ncbi:hypothetical protein [Cloacibacillus evryensis]|uniref:hypothetical protein n=3 Tax=Cloacibacillus evryensis TaxID=508460 RepID=UPI0026722F9F|nr:hypothetical protein [Cloacibacillus evryensis]
MRLIFRNKKLVTQLGSFDTESEKEELSSKVDFIGEKLHFEFLDDASLTRVGYYQNINYETISFNRGKSIVLKIGNTDFNFSITDDEIIEIEQIEEYYEISKPDPNSCFEVLVGINFDVFKQFSGKIIRDVSFQTAACCDDEDYEAENLDEVAEDKHIGESDAEYSTMAEQTYEGQSMLDWHNGFSSDGPSVIFTLEDNSKIVIWCEHGALCITLKYPKESTYEELCARRKKFIFEYNEYARANYFVRLPILKRLKAKWNLRRVKDPQQFYYVMARKGALRYFDSDSVLCQNCGSVFDENSDNKTHYTLRKGGGYTIYTCPYCGFKQGWNPHK